MCASTARSAGPVLVSRRRVSTSNSKGRACGERVGRVHAVPPGQFPALSGPAQPANRPRRSRPDTLASVPSPEARAESRASACPRSQHRCPLARTGRRPVSSIQPRHDCQTIRQSSASLSRQTLSQARSEGKLEEHLELLRCHYNFVRPHGALKVGREVRTPAMQAGLATRRLTFREVFACQPASLISSISTHRRDHVRRAEPGLTPISRPCACRSRR